MNKRGDLIFLRGLIITLIGILLTLIIGFTIFGLEIKDTENGHHTGYVTAIETNGIIFKTDSVYFKTETESSQEDRYCIIDKEIKKQLEEYQRDKKLVTIEFYDNIFRGIKNCKGFDIAIISGVEFES